MAFVLVLSRHTMDAKLTSRCECTVAKFGGVLTRCGEVGVIAEGAGCVP